ncbi:RidA family protein [Clostridiaceae bacterium M8S5]|nr:RidA family protein [Clostridiaceae bacterium M8S5]
MKDKKAEPFYSPYVISGDMMYISGQLPIKDGVLKAVEGGIRQQAKQVLKNMYNLLKEEGLTKKNVVMCKAYITDIKYWEDFNEVYAEFFGDHKPARVVIPISPLSFGCNIELEAIAEIK